MLQEINEETNKSKFAYDNIRRKYLKELFEYTNRNVIIYYSGFLEKPEFSLVSSISDRDVTGFMQSVYQLDKSKGIDLIIHTPGGDLAATESIIHYLQEVFKQDIRVIVPQIAMSSGTMIALASKEIIMGKHSSLGPFDPQIRTSYGMLSAQLLVEEFDHALKEIKEDESKLTGWQYILSKYTPSLLLQSQEATSWAKEIVKEWLSEGMLKGKTDKKKLIEEIISELSDTKKTKSHSRHVHANKGIELGLNITMLEDHPELQEAVLSVHHACIHTISATNVIKIIENQNGKAFVQKVQIQPALVPQNFHQNPLQSSLSTPQTFPQQIRHYSDNFNNEKTGSILELTDYLANSKEYISKLKFNWDGQEAKKISTVALTKALEAVSTICINLWNANINIQLPSVLPNPEGSIDIQWSESEYEILINVSENEISSIFAKTKTGITHEQEGPISMITWSLIYWIQTIQK